MVLYLAKPNRPEQIAHLLTTEEGEEECGCLTQMTRKLLKQILEDALSTYEINILKRILKKGRNVCL